MGVEVGLHEDDFFSLRKVDVGRLLENASVIDGGGVPEWSNGAVSKFETGCIGWSHSIPNSAEISQFS